MHYMHTDHLGSLNVLTSQSGAIEQEISYDAWGNRRDPATLQNYITAPAGLITDRGFTGHEHMEAFKLINMNGRIYDPLLGRFLSADKIVANAASTQDYNRFSYCINNPLSYTDPTGWQYCLYEIDNASYTFPIPGQGAWEGHSSDHSGGGGSYSVLPQWYIDRENFYANPANRHRPWYEAPGPGDGRPGKGRLSPTGYLSGYSTAEKTGGTDWYVSKLNENQYEILSMPSMALVFHPYGAAGGEGGNLVRPDADGYITLNEANNWRKSGNGQPLFAKLPKINLSRISSSDFDGVGSSKVFNLLSPKYISNINDGLVYGNIILTLDKDNYVHATLGYDTYDFDIRPWSVNTFTRNIETIIGRAYAGDGASYNIMLSGAVQLNK